MSIAKGYRRVLCLTGLWHSTEDDSQDQLVEHGSKSLWTDAILDVDKHVYVEGSDMVSQCFDVQAWFRFKQISRLLKSVRLRIRFLTRTTKLQKFPPSYMTIAS